MSMSGDIPRRRLGRTGVEVSIMGVGGYHLGLPYVSESVAIDIVRSAIDAGVNFLDNNWGYNNGASEERMGKALRDGYRDKVVLMTKVDARDKAGALRQLDESLKRLQTDHVDLWQIHEVVYYNDPYLLSAAEGAIEALIAAKEAGKTRFVGFTGHKDPAIHLQMLCLYPFDTVQMPLNVMDTHFLSFERQVLPVAIEGNLGTIGMKTFGDPCIVTSGVVTPREALSYTLSLPISVAVSGIDSMDVLKQNLDIVKGFNALTQQEMETIRQKTVSPMISGDGRYELYKISMKHEAEAGRKTHGMPGMETLPK